MKNGLGEGDMSEAELRAENSRFKRERHSQLLEDFKGAVELLDEVMTENKMLLTADENARKVEVLLKQKVNYLNLD